MSLETDGFWKSGFWSTTFWADGFWFEGAAAGGVETYDLTMAVVMGSFGYIRKKTS